MLPQSQVTDTLAKESPNFQGMLSNFISLKLNQFYTKIGTLKKWLQVWFIAYYINQGLIQETALPHLSGIVEKLAGP